MNRITKIFQTGKKISPTLPTSSSAFVFWQAVEKFKKAFDDQYMLIFPRCLTFLIRSNHFRKKTCLLVDFANAYKSARGYALKKHEEQRVYRLHASWLKAYVSGLQDYDCLPQKANSLLFASCAPGRSVEEFLSTTLMQHYAREFVVDAVNRYGDKGMFHLF